MKRALIALALLLTALSSFGQFTHSRLLQQVRKQGSPVVRTKAQAVPVSQADSALYMHYTKRNGWVEGIGRPLTADEASHRTVYFKLSRRNAAGHWTLVQAFNGLGRLTTGHDIGTYLISNASSNGQGVNKDWQKKIGKVCQWEFIADETGREVLQEVGMDADGQVVYCFVPVKVGDRVYAGSYVDAKGMPVFMRTDTTGNDIGYANFVQITRDADGYERLLQYTDRYGYPQKNLGGAYMQQIEHDRFGNITSSLSLNIVGERMTDLWGNCGWQSTYDEWGNTLTTLYIDNEGQPVRIRGVGADSVSVNQVVCKSNSYDRYGRLIETAFFAGDGKQPDVNQYGVHRTTYTRSRYGYQSGYAYYGLDGQLVVGDTCGVAQRQSLMDDVDNLLQADFFGTGGQYVTSSYGYCRTTREYRGDEIVRQTNYIPAGDSLTTKFYYEKDDLGNELRMWYDRDLICLDSVDDHGNRISRTYYNLKRERVQSNGYHRREYTNTYSPHAIHRVCRIYDEQLRPVLNEPKGWTVEVSDVDSLAFVSKTYCYRNDSLVGAKERHYDASFQNIVSLYEINQWGERSRTAWDDYYYYGQLTNQTIYGNYSELRTVNEFGEPAYLTGIYGGVYHSVRHDGKKREYFDVNGEQIQSTSAKYDELPKVFCVEVTDMEKAQKSGVRTGDIILSYGDWAVSRDLKSNMHGYQIEAILKATQPKTIRVLRHHPKEQSSEIVTISAPAGRPSDLGFFAQLICYTQQEMQRLLNCADDVSFPYGEPQPDDSLQTVILVDIPKGEVYNPNAYWANDMKDPAIMLAYRQYRSQVVPVVNKSWALDSLSLTEVTDSLWAGKVGRPYLVCTNDMAHVFSLDGVRTFANNHRPVKVSFDTYNSLLALYHDWQLTDTLTKENYNWRAQSGPLTQQQVAGQMSSFAKVEDIVEGDEWWTSFSKRYPWFRNVSSLAEHRIYKKDFSRALELIGQLDKRGYEEVVHPQADLLLVQRTGKKKKQRITKFVYVDRQKVYFVEGEFTENVFNRVIELFK